MEKFSEKKSLRPVPPYMTYVQQAIRKIGEPPAV
jgi:hypothetical protein